MANAERLDVETDVKYKQHRFDMWRNKVNLPKLMSSKNLKCASWNCASNLKHEPKRSV